MIDTQQFAVIASRVSDRSRHVADSADSKRPEWVAYNLGAIAVLGDQLAQEARRLMELLPGAGEAGDGE